MIKHVKIYPFQGKLWILHGNIFSYYRLSVIFQFMRRISYTTCNSCISLLPSNREFTLIWVSYARYYRSSVKKDKLIKQLGRTTHTIYDSTLFIFISYCFLIHKEIRLCLYPQNRSNKCIKEWHPILGISICALMHHFQSNVKWKIIKSLKMTISLTSDVQFALISLIDWKIKPAFRKLRG